MLSRDKHRLRQSSPIFRKEKTIESKKPNEKFVIEIKITSSKDTSQARRIFRSIWSTILT